MSDAPLRHPTERTCERCGRTEVWSDEHDAWRVARADGQLRSGSVYCLHEWDITGSFVPVADAADGADA